MLRQIQRHQVAIRRKTATGISRLQPEQRDFLGPQSARTERERRLVVGFVAPFT